MLSSLLLSLALAQAPASPVVPAEPLAVVVSSQRPGCDALASKVAAQVQQALVAAGADRALTDEKAHQWLTVSKLEPATCVGATACLGKVAAALGKRAVVVGVDLTPDVASFKVHLEAVASGQSDSLVAIDFSVDADDWQTQSAEPLTAFVGDLVPRLSLPPALPAPRPAPPGADVPRAAVPVEPMPEPSPEPQPTLPITVHQHQQASAGRRALPWLTTAGAVAGLGVAGSFSVMGNNDQRLVTASLSLLNGQQVSSLTRADFNAAVSRGNERYTVAFIGALCGAAFLALSLALFAAGD